MIDVTRWLETTLGRLASRGDSSPEVRRARVVLAAVEAIDAGSPTVGLGEIAERAGLQRPNVYRLFESRDELDNEVAGFAATELIRRVRPQYSNVGTPEEIIRGIVGAAADWASEHPNLYRFMAARHQTRALHKARTGRTRLLNEVVEAVQGYFPHEKLSGEAPDGVMAGLMGMTDATIIWWLDHGDESRDAMVARVSRQISVVLVDLMAQLGIAMPSDIILRPKADGWLADDSA